MKQRIEPYERQKIKDLLLSGDETNYKLALQLLSIFFDKREARKFIWYECLACYAVPTLIRHIAANKDVYRLKNQKEAFDKIKLHYSDAVRKWIHSGNKDAAYLLYNNLYANTPDDTHYKLLQFLNYCY